MKMFQRMVISAGPMDTPVPAYFISSVSRRAKKRQQSLSLLPEGVKVK